jgi:HD-GYP domain-containing protein (c-di-GMP phosphodiesterase class II)
VPEALTLADQRMYAHKRSGRVSAGRQSRDVLLRAVQERNPQLGVHVDGVAVLAGRIAQRLGVSGEQLAIIRHGAGYPDRLAGEQIPLGSRIIAVCDAWDAMTTDRPYRAAMSRDDAIAELWRCAGTQFDPAVVEAFCAAVSELSVPAAA